MVAVFSQHSQEGMGTITLAHFNLIRLENALKKKKKDIAQMNGKDHFEQIQLFFPTKTGI